MKIITLNWTRAENEDQVKSFVNQETREKVWTCKARREVDSETWYSKLEWQFTQEFHLKDPTVK